MKQYGIIIGILLVIVLGTGTLIIVHSDAVHSVSAATQSASSVIAVQQQPATTTSLVATTTPLTKLGSTTDDTIAASTIRFEVVTTPASQEQGLGGRAVIPDNYAMLFVFAKPDTYGFWMKDMLAPIDMVWLSDSGTIIKIDASVPANTYPKIYYPPAPVRYVLETRAGYAAAHDWKLGTTVQLPLPYGK